MTLHTHQTNRCQKKDALANIENRLMRLNNPLLSFALLGNVRLGEVGLGAFDGKSNMIDARD